MTRYEDTHESIKLIHNIYEAEKTSALKMESKEISVLACVWNKCFAIASWYVLN